MRGKHESYVGGDACQNGLGRGSEQVRTHGLHGQVRYLELDGKRQIEREREGEREGERERERQRERQHR